MMWVSNWDSQPVTPPPPQNIVEALNFESPPLNIVGDTTQTLKTSNA